jgi:hypothetical protein
VTTREQKLQWAVTRRHVLFPNALAENQAEWREHDM